MPSLFVVFTLYIGTFLATSSSFRDDSEPSLMRRLLDDDGTGSTSSTGSNCPGDSFCAGRRDGNYANPDSYSKNYFIQCSGGYAYCTQCPDELVYNPTSVSCERSTTGPGTRAQPLGSPDPVYNDDEGNCPDASYCSEFSNPGRYDPHENPSSYNRHYYIQCVPGDDTTGGDRLYCMPCPDGLIFVDGRNCIRPNICPDDDDDYCSWVSKDGQFVDDYPNPPEYPQNYYVHCNSDSSTICEVCPDGLIFDFIAGQCVLPENKEIIRDCPSGYAYNYFRDSCVPISALDITTTNTDDGNRASGPSGSPPANNNDDDNNKNCPDDSYCNGQASIPQQNPKEYNPNYYIQCDAGGILRCMQCPDGLVFGPHGACMFPDDPNYYIKDATKSTTTPTTTTWTSSTSSPWSSTTDDDGNRAPAAPVIPTRQCPGNSFCDGKDLGIYANPDGYSNTFFVQCGPGGIAYCQPCAPGTFWNDSVRTCTPF